MTNLRRFFDFGFHIPGKKVLRLMLWLQVLLLLVSISKFFDMVILQAKVKTSMNEEIITDIGGILIMLYDAISIYFLWKGIKLVSKRYLKAFVIFRVILLPPLILTFLLYKIYGSKYRTNDVQQHLVHLFLNGLTVLVRIYTIIVVYEYQKKLESPILMYLREHSNLLKNFEISYHVYSSHPLLNYKSEADLPQPDENFVIGVNQLELEKHILSPLDVIIDTNSVLGEGQLGTVYKGIIHKNKDKITIAAKVAKDVLTSEREMLLKELQILVHVGEHDNIIKFHGITSDASLQEHAALITEYCSFGCLEDFLKEHRHTFIEYSKDSGIKDNSSENNFVYVNLEKHGTHSITDLIRFTVDIANGMEHLASKGVVHGDLSCRNVLITKDLKAKLSDFGMSRKLYAYQVYSTIPQQKGNLPWRWMSIEAIEDLNLSEKSDVWSYGVTLWELYTLGKFPFEGIEWSPRISNQLREGLIKLEKPRYATDSIYTLMNECWKIDLKERPTFSELKSKTIKILEEYTLVFQN